MKQLIQSIYSNPGYEKAVEWGKLITITGLTQSFVQAISLICGILIIRLLPTPEYALYTLANAMLGTMINLADGGIASSVMAQCGRVWQNPKSLGMVLATGFDLRKKFAVVSLLVAIPVLLYLLHYHGSGWFMSTVIVLAMVPPFFTTLYGHLLEIIPKIRQHVIQLQKIQAGNNIIRLTLLIPAIIIFPYAFIALSVTSLSQLWANHKLYKISKTLVNWKQLPDPSVRQEIMSFVKLSLPSAIYFSISGQIMIWIISIFGTTQAIAQVGAIGRLGMLLIVFSTLFSILVAPRFSKLPNNPKVLLSRYLQIQAGLLVLTILIVGAVASFPNTVLWILGSRYSNLQAELILGIVGSCLNLIVGITMNLYESRGWIIKPLLSICTSLLTIIIGVWLINISTLRGIFIFNIFQGITSLIIHFSFGLIMITKTK